MLSDRLYDERWKNMDVTLAQDEVLRLQALERYEILVDTPDPALDDITRLAAQICAAPIATVVLVDAESVWLPSRIGILETSLPRTAAPFDSTLVGDGIYQVLDAGRDAEFAPNGMSIGGYDLRFFAGSPLITPGGQPIGALCVFDILPRKLTNQQMSALELLGRQVITRFELNFRVREMDRAARQRQRVESALTVERNFVSTVLDTVGALVIVFDTAGRIVRFNRACETISGYRSSDLVGRYVWDRLIPEDDVPEAIATFDRISSGNFPATFENHWRAADGGPRRIAWSATALVDGQNQVAFVIATGIDVTIERGAAETLRESEARYRQLIEGSLGVVFTQDLNGNLVSMNTYGAQSLGRDMKDMVGHALTEFMPEINRSEMPSYLRQVCDGEAQGRFHLSHRNGEVHILAYRNKLIDLPGREPYILGFAVDITEQVRAEELLRNLMRQSNSILEAVGDGIYGIDLEGRVTVVNPAAAQMLGYKPEEMLGRNMHELVHHTRPDGKPYHAEDCSIQKTLLHRDTVRVSDEVFWRKDGSSFPVEYVARPQIESDGKPVGVVVAFTDTTERRALDRMKDEFISTVSHELRTPLTSIRASLGLLNGGALASRPEKQQQMLEMAIGNTDRLVRLVNDILDLERIGSGKAELQQAMCSIDDLCHKTTHLQQANAQKTNIRFAFDTNNIMVFADADRIIQLLTNLVSNAIKFSPPDSEIRFSARTLDADEALIEVSDQGRGIPTDKLESIFERFQQVDASDSRAMGGTGLGLAICRSIVTQHGGRIWATSKPGRGSTFHFTLPTRPSQSLRNYSSVHAVAVPPKP